MKITVEHYKEKVLSDFPKIQCPFVRKEFGVNKEQHKKYGRKLQLRQPKVYLAINEINKGYEWVFNDEDTFAVEKLDGTNVKIQTENGRLIALQNRLNVIDPLRILKGNNAIIEAVFKSIQKGYIKDNTIQAGEVIGEKLQGNPLKISGHLYYPFDKAIKDLTYNSFKQHPPTFNNLSSWFKDYLKSRFAIKYHNVSFVDCDIFAEGVIFYNLKRKEQGKSYMAKLRRDMFEWYYSDKIEIYDYKGCE